ncbi:hypothetical protein [Leucobacter japonicus]|uniref:hypothetical protein n=1 Tax=Leucobacter japonicus TaxID=1461259 RepID=UPI0006A77F23|nr:hypothetical protein [Leucobacter japonicus]
MREKSICLSGGFEDQLGTVHAVEGDYPSETDMSLASGTQTSPAHEYFTALWHCEDHIHREIQQLDNELQRLQSEMKAAIDEQRAADDETAATLTATIPEIEGIGDDINGSTPAPDGTRNADDTGDTANTGQEWML